MDRLQMEHGFLKAPWEILVKNFRAGHKPLARDVELAASAVTALQNKIFSNVTATATAADGTDGTDATTAAECAEAVQVLRTRLLQLKKSVEATRKADEKSIKRCHMRIQHLQIRAWAAEAAAAETAAATAEEGAGALARGGGAACGEDGDVGDEQAPTAMQLDTPAATTTPLSPPATNGHPTAVDAPGAGPMQGDAASPPGAQAEPAATIAANAAPPISPQLTGPSHAELTSRWEKTRLDRALVDYMLREGMYDTAETLTSTHAFHALVDIPIFQESRTVIEALRRRDCSEALRWCTENKRRLQKVQSKLEFRLRLQQFVELARTKQKTAAIAYMRKHLVVNFDDERLKDIQRFMGLLVFDSTTACQPYKDLYGEHKWVELENEFKQDNYRLHGLTRESTIEILLKAGLASLKTRKCGTEADSKSNCPTCVEPFLSLSKELPRSRHENSVLVCSISGEIMDENNPPMALPKGNVYSLNALKKIAAENDGYVIDPRTQDKAKLSELRKCFIM